MNIITDKSKLTKHIQSAIKAYNASGRAIHVAVVSALWHAAKHGDPSLFNAVFDALRPNDKQAVQLYVRRAAAVVGLNGKNPDGLPAEKIVGAVEAGAFMSLSKGAWIVTQGHTSKQAKATATLCEKSLINPDGENFRYVLDRHNMAEIKTLGDTQVLDAVIAISKQLQPTERRAVNVTDQVRDFVTDFVGKAKAMKDQRTLNEG